jgi:hypothetical protein
VVVIFVEELIDPSAGGGPWILLALILGVAAVVAFFVWRSSRRSKERRRATLEELRSKAQSQVDAVANDILEDEDEIEEAGNPEASRHFDDATRIYGRAAEELPGATTPAEIVGISAELDQAIWHLDAAEAILDGKPVPPKPEPPVLPPPESTRTVPAQPSPQQPTSLPRYERRSSRRSGFGAEDMLSAVLAMQAMRSLSGRSGRAGGRSSRSGGGRSRSSGRSRGGGRRRR